MNTLIMPFKMLFKYELLLFMYTMFENDKTIRDRLKIDHRMNTRKKNKQLTLPWIKTGNGRRSVFYSGVQPVIEFALDLVDLPSWAFLAARLWELDLMVIEVGEVAGPAAGDTCPRESVASDLGCLRSSLGLSDQHYCVTWIYQWYTFFS